jgi:ABC-type multidrug transport system fused ATPase/permease subunit
MAQALDFILMLPQGIDTRIGVDGKDLSGGERQRLGIARAIYKDTKIFLFDEPTSALDLKTEGMIVKKLDKSLKNKTLITITHNPKSVKHFDNIILLDDGKIIATGTFDELITKSSLFKAILSKDEKNVKN